MRSAKAVADDIKHDEIMRRCTNRTLLRQISQSEISQLIKYIMSEEAQNRLAKLPLGTCTLFDKRTLAASNRLLISFENFHKQPLMLPRTIIAMRKTETVVEAYILLGCKLADASNTPPTVELKDRRLKMEGAFKQKTNALCISISDNINEIAVELIAVLKVRKKVKNYMDWLKISLHTALVQHTLAQQCAEIMDCIPLTLDETFTKYNLYIVSKLGRELHTMVRQEKLSDPNHQTLIIKDICKALCFLHRLKISHRDIKLENAIVMSGMRPKLIDFDFIEESGHGNTFCGTVELLPFYVLGIPQGRKHKVSKNAVSNLQLEETEKQTLYEACRRGAAFCDIWAFGVVLFTIHNAMDFDSKDGSELLASYKNSANMLEQIIYQILCPEQKDCYLLATEQQLQQDLAQPLSQRKYLSMDKLHYMLFNEEYTLDARVVQELQPRMRQLIAMRPKLSS